MYLHTYIGVSLPAESPQRPVVVLQLKVGLLVVVSANRSFHVTAVPPAVSPQLFVLSVALLQQPLLLISTDDIHTSHTKFGFFIFGTRRAPDIG